MDERTISFYQKVLDFGPRIKAMEDRLDELERFLGIESYVEGHRVIGEATLYGPGNPDWERDRVNDIEDEAA